MLLVLAGRLSGQGSDSLRIAPESTPIWDALQPGKSYMCVADLDHRIRPYDRNVGENFTVGKLLVSGRPNARVLLTFVFPDILWGTASGLVHMAYTDSSLGVADPGSAVVREYYDPHDSLELRLDSLGLAWIYVAGNPSPTIDATDGDTFLGLGQISGAYADSGTPGESAGDSMRMEAEIEFAVTVWSFQCGLCVGAGASKAFWTSLHPGVSYRCKADSVPVMNPIDSDNPESIGISVLDIFGSPGAYVELRYDLPTALLSSELPGHVTLSYDSLSAAWVDYDYITYRRVTRFNPALPCTVRLNEMGVVRVLLTANPSVSADAREGDTLTAFALATGEYTGILKGQSIKGRSQQASWDVELQAVIGGSFSLAQNYPNPFNPSTTIAYYLPVSSRVRLSMYNLLGEEVAVLTDRDEQQGAHTATWDGKNHASGVYFYRLVAGNALRVKKLVLLR
jgi:hypothetical protein